jgi:hypothetical protein
MLGLECGPTTDDIGWNCEKYSTVLILEDPEVDLYISDTFLSTSVYLFFHFTIQDVFRRVFCFGKKLGRNVN